MAIIMEGGKVDRVGKGGGNKEVESGDVVEEEESNTTIRAVGKVEERWTKMSTIGGNDLANDWVEGGGGVVVVAGMNVVGGGERGCSGSSSLGGVSSSSIVATSNIKVLILPLFGRGVPSVVFLV